MLDVDSVLSPPSVQMRHFADVGEMRNRIFDQVLGATQTLEPISNNRYSLQLVEPHYAGPDAYSYAAQKKAILSGQSLARELRGTWQLTDVKTGNVVAKKRSRLAMIPYLTDRGTFIYRGNEYTLANQSRLRPGVYTRIKDNGELEAHVNALPGKGRTHRIFLEPESGVFNVQIGQSRIPLLPLLRSMGATDSQLREAWGNELMAVNLVAGDNPKAINKLAERFARGPFADEAGKRTAIAEAVNAIELDPEVTARTLGKPYKNLSLDAILDTTRKLLAISRKEAEPDDRSNMVYQTVLGPEDIFAERVSKAKSVLRNALWKASSTGTLDRMPVNALDHAVHAALLSSGLGMPLEEVNPLDIFDQLSRVTQLGEGGIGSIDQVTDEARAVQPSQLGFLDYLRTPESEKVGVDLRIARNVKKGSDGRLYTQVRDVSTGESVYKSPQDLVDHALAFPGQMESGRRAVYALSGGRMQAVPRDQVKYELIHNEDAFSPLGNLIPMKSNVAGQRAVMAARMFTQALPLVDAEAPLVQSGIPGQPDRSFEEEYAKYAGALFAKQPGRITNVTPDGITVKHADGKEHTYELYDALPFNRKTLLSHTPAVRPGDFVDTGQLLASSNYTTPEGTLALGKNARVAYIPFRGHAYEDAIVISDSFAKRMTSTHMYQHSHEWAPEHRQGKNTFIGMFPTAYPRKTLANFNNNGVIRPGTRIEKGDPLILVAKEQMPTRTGLLRKRKPSFANKSVVWEHDTPGIVTDVHVDDKAVQVVVKTDAPMNVGDKLSGRFGDKGIVSAIVPDDQMPTDATGKPFEVLLNPLGVGPRGNPAQIFETILSKIAKLRGKPYKIEDFSKIDDMAEFVEDEMRKHGVKDLEDVVDPETNRKIKDILVGNRWFMKLHHTSESKAVGRGLGAYTAEGVPARGGRTGSKRIGLMEATSLLAHGATDVLRDASLIRGQASPQYWTQFMAGYKPPTPSVPFVYQKFVNDLRGAGINAVRSGSSIHIMALTDDDIDKLAEGREIQNVDTVDWKKDLKPRKGGLFDERLTGGLGGTRWSTFQLHEPMPNPVMEEPIRRILGLTEKQMLDILAGRRELHGRTGPKAIQQALDQVDLKKEIERARSEIASGKKTYRDNAIRRLGFLKSADRLGIHPRQWMLSKVPVLPPAYRPISVMGPNKLSLVADPNFLYKELFEANTALREMSDVVDDVGTERLATYNALKAVVGLGDPIHPQNRDRRIRGILKHVFGASPKVGVVQQRLIGGAVDFAGRSVIAPNPELDMDQVALPEDNAWEIYKPFVVRQLVRQGMPRLAAVRAAQERSADAREALVAEMQARPVLINRAPTLHRYGIMAAWPRLTKNKVLEISPLVTKGFGADFDGDTMNYHVPTTDEAVQEAIDRMLPSRNLFSAATFDVHYKPSHEYAGGLYEASARVDTQSKPKVFATIADAIRAYKRGEIGAGQRVEIIEA